MRNAKAEAANMVRKGVLRGGLKGRGGEASKVLAKLGPPRGHQHI